MQNLKIIKVIFVIVAILVHPATFSATITKTQPEVTLNPNDRACLVNNVYHEARGEPIEGQIAVAQVTLNRAKETKMNVCQVVNESGQFSWVGKNKKIVNREAKNDIEQVVQLAVKGYRVREVGSSVSFHNNKIARPRWAAKMRKTATVGSHTFYKND